MIRTGQTLAGQALWSKAEAKTLCNLYPNYTSVRKVLTKRTYPAIQKKAWRLGITKPLRIWTDVELHQLRALYRSAMPVQEIARLFDKTKKQVWNRARHSSLRRPLKPPKVAHLKPFDGVRSQAFATGLTTRDLAFLSKTDNYFLGRPSRSDWRKISKAVTMLGGDMCIMWKAP